jgi:hypothetical protein
MSECPTAACNTHSLQSSVTQRVARVHQPRGSESNMAATCSSESGVAPVSNEVAVSCCACVPNVDNGICVRVL